MIFVQKQANFQWSTDAWRSFEPFKLDMFESVALLLYGRHLVPVTVAGDVELCGILHRKLRWNGRRMLRSMNLSRIIFGSYGDNFWRWEIALKYIKSSTLPRPDETILWQSTTRHYPSPGHTLFCMKICIHREVDHLVRSIQHQQWAWTPGKLTAKWRYQLKKKPLYLHSQSYSPYSRKLKLASKILQRLKPVCWDTQTNQLKTRSNKDVEGAARLREEFLITIPQPIAGNRKKLLRPGELRFKLHQFVFTQYNQLLSRNGGWSAKKEFISVRPVESDVMEGDNFMSA